MCPWPLFKLFFKSHLDKPIYIYIYIYVHCKIATFAKPLLHCESG